MTSRDVPILYVRKIASVFWSWAFNSKMSSMRMKRFRVIFKLLQDWTARSRVISSTDFASVFSALHVEPEPQSIVSKTKLAAPVFSNRAFRIGRLLQQE